MYPYVFNISALADRRNPQRDLIPKVEHDDEAWHAELVARVESSIVPCPTVAALFVRELKDMHKLVLILSPEDSATTRAILNAVNLNGVPAFTRVVTFDIPCILRNMGDDGMYVDSSREMIRDVQQWLRWRTVLVDDETTIEQLRDAA